MAIHSSRPQDVWNKITENWMKVKETELSFTCISRVNWRFLLIVRKNRVLGIPRNQVRVFTLQGSLRFNWREAKHVLLLTPITRKQSIRSQQREALMKRHCLGRSRDSFSFRNLGAPPVIINKPRSILLGESRSKRFKVSIRVWCRVRRRGITWIHKTIQPHYPKVHSGKEHQSTKSVVSISS